MMTKNIFFFVFLIMFFIQGCASTSYARAKGGVVKVGMTRVEVSSVWGEPQDKELLDKEDRLGRYELWYYPKDSFLGGHTVEVSFNKAGIVVFVETLYK